jgi:mandelate racemase
MPKDSSPTIKEFKVRVVRVPMKEPHQTASGVITESPLVLTDIITDAGIIGHSIVFTYTPAALKPTAELIQNFEVLVQGDVLAPAEIEQKLTKRFRLLGTQGLVGIALAAIDMALWDALARIHNISLITLLGGIKKTIRAYGAVGYDGVKGSGDVAERWAQAGFTGVKAKIGYPTVEEDVAVIRAIRKATGDDMAIMVDYNQCLTPTEAIARMRVLDDEGLTWVEEPTLAHDYAGHALVAREAQTPIQAGENWWGIDEDRRSKRLAQGCGNRTRKWYSCIQSSLARDQFTSFVLHADRALVGVCGLVEPYTGRAASNRDGPGDHRRKFRHGCGME